jgi:predicted RNase H-like HicB family nuclease
MNANPNPPGFSAVFMKVPQGYVAFVEELPGANTQADTPEKAREDLKEAVAPILRPTGPSPRI